MAYDVTSFFTNIDNLKAQDVTSSKDKYKNRLKFVSGKKCYLRLVPYVKEGPEGFNKTMFHLYSYSWKDIKSGRNCFAISPRTWGEKCPMGAYYFAAKENQLTRPDVWAHAQKLSYKESWYYNVYVIDDEANPENNGKVMVLNAGKQINNIIEKALSNDEDLCEELECSTKEAMFDLSDNGINLVINPTTVADFLNYTQSKFSRVKRAIGLSKAQIDEVYMNAYDLTTIDEQRSSADVGEYFASTFLGKTIEKEAAPARQTVAAAPVKTAAPVKEEVVEDLVSYDVDIENLDDVLKDLDL